MTTRHEDADEVMRVSQMLSGSAMLHVVQTFRMLTEDELSTALGGAKLSGFVLGLPVCGRTMYPAFQFDDASGNVSVAVSAVNGALGVEDDPWGVASWWASPHARLNGQAPYALVGTVREPNLLTLANDVTSE